ncbi:HPr(Ser) kinase/phosphatase [bacterium]|nr:HPr(Ser) kinase/phosphatase [bacterium]
MSQKTKKRTSISVETLFLENKKSLKLKLISRDSSFQKQISEKDLHRPGLALAGFVDLFTYRRIQVCGNTEMTYLRKLSVAQREKTLKKVLVFDIPCIIVTSNNKIFPEFIRLADEHQVSIFRTPFATTRVFQLLGDYLDEKFAPKIFIHGTLVDVYGIGVLITGRSAIGKSEIALDLVSRGHRLVADDVVTVIRRAGDVLIGRGNDTLKYHMEIRGLGVINIQPIFGIRGIRRQKRVEVQLELVDWDKSEKYERLGLEEITTEILGVKIPLVRLPVYPGKNISVIAEVSALNQLLKIYGHNTAKKFQKELTQQILGKLEMEERHPDHNFE